MNKNYDKKPLSQYKLNSTDKNRKYSVVSRFISHETNEIKKEKTIRNDVKEKPVTKDNKALSAVSSKDKSKTTFQTDKNIEKEKEQHEQESRKQNVVRNQKKAMAVHSMLDVQSEEKVQSEKAIERNKQSNADNSSTFISYSEHQYREEQPKQQIQTEQSVQNYAPTYRPIRKIDKNDRHEQKRKTNERTRKSSAQDERNTKDIYKKITQITELTVKNEAQKKEIEKRQELSRQQQQTELRAKAQQLQERLKAETLEQQKRNEYIENQKRNMFKGSFSDIQNAHQKEETRHEEQKVVALTAFGAISQKKSEDNTKSVQLSKEEYNRAENVNTYKKAERQKEYFDKKKKANRNTDNSDEKNENGKGISIENGVVIAENVGKGVATGAAIVGTAAEVTAKTAYKTAKFTKEAAERAAKIQESLSSGSSIGQAGSNAVKEVERQAKEDAKRTAKKTAQFTAKRLKDAAVESSKKAYQALKRERLNRIAKRKAYQAMRRRKEAFYKAKNDIRPTNLLKLLFAKGLEFIGHFGEGSVNRAVIICVICVVVVVLVACMIIPILFFWLDPHSSEVYDGSAKAYTTLEHKTDKEVIESYYSVIQDVVDEKQINIFHVTEKDWDGFDPDDYQYTPEVRVYSDPYDVEKYYIITQERWHTCTTSNANDIVGTQHDIAYSNNRILVGEKKISGKSTELEILVPGFEHVVQTGTLSSAEINALQSQLQERFKGTHFYFSEEEALKHKTIQPVGTTAHTPNGDVSVDTGIEHTIWSWVDYSAPTLSVVYQKDVRDSWLEPLTDLNIWALNETDNKWIKFNEEIDYEAFIALTALIKFRKFAYNIDFDPSGLETGTNTENTSEKPDKTEDSSEMNNADEPSVDNIYHLTRADFQKTLNMLCSFNWGFYYGQCPSKNCRRRGTSNGGVQVYCGQSHAHLRAHCANWTDHGLDFVLDAILAGSADTYETDKEVFGAYLDFVRDTMDKTPSDDEDVYSTPLPDYELSTEDLNRITEKSKILPNNSGFVQPPHCGVNH